jgi:hypothetical protein
MRFFRMMVAAVALGLVVIPINSDRRLFGQSSPRANTPLSQNLTPLAVEQGADNILMYQDPNARRGDPEMGRLMNEESKLEREVGKLVQDYSRTEDEGQRSKIRTKLSTILQSQFDLQQKRRDLEVTRIETQLKKLRELMQKRTAARQSIVEKRLDQLLREADGLGWTPPAGPGIRNYYRAVPAR